jgi:phospholipid-binding lipoprotein MlaA
MRTLNAGLAAALCAAALGGCAGTSEYADPRDPLEPMNRAVYKFNDAVDTAIARPVATAYVDVVPEPARNYVRNFFGNLADVLIGANNVLQGKVAEGLQDWFRVAVNTVMGPLGINDWASEMGIEEHNEDFGQTFGWWGAGPGAYLVLPVLGPSSVRDGAGTVLDMALDPVGEIRPTRARNSAVLLRVTSARADLLEAGRILEQAALDKYVFLRDAYLQRRRSLVYDGRPPRERYDDEPADEEEKPAAREQGARNVYLPQVPPNYDAVMAIQGKTDELAKLR